MTCLRLALFTALLAAPAFASPATEATYFTGALTDETPRLRLAQAEQPVAQPPLDPDDVLLSSPIENMTKAQLRAEYRRLDEAKPGIGLGIALASIGGGLTLTGLIILLTAAGSYAAVGFVAATAVLLGVSIAFIAAGAVLIVIGCIKIGTSAGKRHAYSQRMDDINARIEQLDHGAPTAPIPGDLPPPPPPPPPGAMFGGPQPSLVLASF